MCKYHLSFLKSQTSPKFYSVVSQWESVNIETCAEVLFRHLGHFWAVFADVNHVLEHLAICTEAERAPRVVIDMTVQNDGIGDPRATNCTVIYRVDSGPLLMYSFCYLICGVGKSRR